MHTSAATLEALVQDPKVLDTGLSTRIALYRLFTKIWNSVALNGKPSAVAQPSPLSAICPNSSEATSGLSLGCS